MEFKEVASINEGLVAFSDQSILESFDRISLFVSSDPRFDISKLEENVEPELLHGMGDLLEKASKANISPETSDRELNDFSDKVFEKISQWDLPKREVLNATLVSKILHNIEYAQRNMTPQHLRDVLYRKNETSDLIWVWLDIYRQKLTGNKRSI